MLNDPENHQDIERVLFSKNVIIDRVEEMGREITADYEPVIESGEEIVLVCLLRGAAIFMADLARAIKLPVNMDYMAVSSYGQAAKSSGMVRIQKDLSEDIAGKHVIIVEDVIDTGLTLKYIQKNLASRGPLSVEVACLIRKEHEGQKPVNVKYYGLDCPDEFIVGYGLDYAERYRNMEDICVLKPSVYE